jgi:hypothetical protein
MIRCGSTRAVLPIGPWAFKISRSKYGARCNRYEADLYRRCRTSRPERQLMLCPVLWSLLFGWLLIARRAETPITQGQLADRKAHAFDEWGVGDDEYPFEWKPTDWGILDGRIVAVDYAATVLSAEDEKIIAEHEAAGRS